LGATTVVLVLNALAALSASLNPKFGNDFVVGSAYLCVGMPLLAIVSYRFARTLRHN
jgi:hypothetical protein